MTQEEKSLEERRQEPYKLMDLADEKEIIASLSGAYLKGMVYTFDQGGRTVTGVSYTGIKEIAYQLAVGTKREINIDPDTVTREEDEDYYYVTMMAHHHGVGTRIGTAVQAKKFSNGNKDPFAFVKAYSKAQRNALRAVLPELTIAAFIEQARGEGRTRSVESTVVPSYTYNEQRKFWECPDTGIEPMETPVGDKVLDHLEDAGFDPSKMKMGKYGENVVLYLDSVDKIKPYTKAMDDLKEPELTYIQGYKSSHWVPTENLPKE